MTRNGLVLKQDEKLSGLLRDMILLAGDEERLNELRKQVHKEMTDWAAVAELIRAEHIAPLLFQQIKGRSIAPLQVEDQLERSYLANAKRNMLLLHELRRVLSLLGEAGIEPIVLKGGALAEIAYGNIALRMMRDLDLLVRNEEVQRTLQVLSEAGYRTLRAEPRLGMAMAYENEIGLWRQGPLPFFVEVHWSLLDSPFYQELSFDWVQKSAICIQTDSGAMRTLGPEAQVLYYAGHIQLHHAQEPHMQWLYDVKQILQMYEEEIDWDRILYLARENYLILPLRKTLITLAEEWAALIPEEVLHHLEMMEVTKAEAEVFTALTASRRPVAQRLWTDLKMMSSWRRRFHYAWINLFPSRVYMFERYGFSSSARLPLYYLYRLYVGLRG